MRFSRLETGPWVVGAVDQGIHALAIVQIALAADLGIVAAVIAIIAKAIVAVAHLRTAGDGTVNTEKTHAGLLSSLCHLNPLALAPVRAENLAQAQEVIAERLIIIEELLGAIAELVHGTGCILGATEAVIHALVESGIANGAGYHAVGVSIIAVILAASGESEGQER